MLDAFEGGVIHMRTKRNGLSKWEFLDKFEPLALSFVAIDNELFLQSLLKHIIMTFIMT